MNPIFEYVEYVVKQNESLPSIARKFYGNAKLWKFISEQNPHIEKASYFCPAGTVIKIPIL